MFFLECAKAAHVSDEITFISDVRRKFFSKFGALAENGPPGTCRRFAVVVDVSSTFKLVKMDELDEADMAQLRACLEEFPIKQISIAPPTGRMGCMYSRLFLI